VARLRAGDALPVVAVLRGREDVSAAVVAVLRRAGDSLPAAALRVLRGVVAKDDEPEEGGRAAGR
jgi:hypothetical protein